jgi:hypothetical protein
MHVDDNLYAAAGVKHMQWAMRCSIAGLQIILGENDPDLRPCQPDLDKFLQQPVSYERRQLGYITNSRTMMVTIPEDKCHKMVELLQHSWGSATTRFSFRLKEAAEVLGLLIYLCRVCPWGMFLFQNLYHAMAQVLARNAQRIFHDPKMRNTIAKCDRYRRHPTDSSKYRFLSRQSHGPYTTPRQQFF